MSSDPSNPNFVISPEEWEFNVSLLGPVISDMATNMNYNRTSGPVTNHMATVVENVVLETPSSTTHMDPTSATRMDPTFATRMDPTSSTTHMNPTSTVHMDPTSTTHMDPSSTPPLDASYMDPASVPYMDAARYDNRARAALGNQLSQNWPRADGGPSSSRRRQHVASRRLSDEDEENVQFLLNLLPYVRKIPSHRKQCVETMLRTILVAEQQQTPSIPGPSRNAIPPYPPPPYPGTEERKPRDFKFTVPEIPPWRRPVAPNSGEPSTANVAAPHAMASSAYNDSVNMQQTPAAQTTDPNAATWGPPHYSQ